jgi:hypothetical protein
MHWPSSWLATLKHVYANPADMFASRWTAENGGPTSGGYGEYEGRFIAKVLRGENALNDVLNVTLSLLPDGFHQRLADAAAPGAVDLTDAGDVTHSYRDHYGYAERSGNDVTQPDHLIAGPSSIMGIELKVRAKSNVKQLLHYCVLAGMEEELRGVAGSHLLLLLSPRATLADTMHGDGVTDAASARTAMLDAAADYHSRGVRSRFISLERLRDVIPRMTVAHMPFARFVELMRLEEIGSIGPAANTLRKLVDGAEAEFDRHHQIAGVRSIPA